MSLWFAGATFDSNANSAARSYRPQKRIAGDIPASRTHINFGSVHGQQEARPMMRISGDIPCSRTHLEFGGVKPDGTDNQALGVRFQTPQRVATARRGYSINPITQRPMTAGAPEDARTNARAAADFNAVTSRGAGMDGRRCRSAGASNRNNELTALYSDNCKTEHDVFTGVHRSPIFMRHEERVQRASPAIRQYPLKEPRGAPFDTETALQDYGPNTPRMSQRKMVDPPTGRRLCTDEDEFVIKTSRNPPADKTERSDKEGFTVLLSSDPSRLRQPLDGMRMVDRRGRVASDFILRTARTRVDREEAVLAERRERCERALVEERQRMATRKSHDVSFMSSKNRSHTPPPSVHVTPFALNISAPHANTVGKSTPWWKRA